MIPTPVRLMAFGAAGGVWFAVAAVSCSAPDSAEINTFPLIGKHIDVSCSECHFDDPFDVAPDTCGGCHEGEQEPGHYEGECGNCHTPLGWGEAIDHDQFFPTPHRGVSECVDCHLDTPDNSTFSCIDCHEHRKSEMDDEHRGEVSGYRWESNACLDCHPDGRE